MKPFGSISDYITPFGFVSNLLERKKSKPVTINYNVVTINRKPGRKKAKVGRINRSKVRKSFVKHQQNTKKAPIGRISSQSERRLSQVIAETTTSPQPLHHFLDQRRRAESLVHQLKWHGHGP